MFSPANITTLTPNFSDGTVLFKVFQSFNTSYTSDARPKTVMTTNTQAYDYAYIIIKLYSKYKGEHDHVYMCIIFSPYSGLELLEYSYAHGNQHI